MHDILFFPFIFCEFDNVQILKAAETCLQFLFRHSSHHCHPNLKKVFSPQVSHSLQNKWLHIPSKTTQKYLFLPPVPVQVEEESFTWHHVD